MIENTAVEDAMKAYGAQVDALIQTSQDAHMDRDQQSALRHAALDIAYACRAELSREWSPSWGFRR